MACLEASLFAMDFLHPDFSLLLQSPGHFEFSTPASDFLKLGVLSPSQGFGQLELSSSVINCARFGPSMLAFDRSGMGSSLPLRSPAQLDFAFSVFQRATFGLFLLTFDYLRLDSSSFIQSHEKLGSVFLVMSFTKLGSFLPVLDMVFIELLMSLRSFS